LDERNTDKLAKHWITTDDVEERFMLTVRPDAQGSLGLPDDARMVLMGLKDDEAV